MNQADIASKATDPLLEQAIGIAIKLSVFLIAQKQIWEEACKVYQTKGYMGDVTKMIHLAEELPNILQILNDKVNEYYYSMLCHFKPIMKETKENTKP